MADPTRNLESILAALGKPIRDSAASPRSPLTSSSAAQKAPTSTPPQGQPGLPPPPAGGAAYPLPQAPYQAQPPSAPGYGAPPPAYSYPQPTSSGNLDLSSVQPTQSGSVSIDEAIARAKAHAARNGVTPYERPANYNPPSRGDGERYRGSRSRSPPARRDAFRDNHNPYRDERREDRGGYGRDRSFSPRGHDQNSGAFSPRGGHASGRDGGDDNSEVIEVEASLVGLIIGRQGENLRRVEGDSQCRVQFLPASSPSADQRQCKITGPRARRAEAKAAINRIIEDSGMGAIARAGLDRGGRDAGRGAGPSGANTQPPLKEGEDCLQIMVPDRTVGLIIGRGGETIRDLQERSGCHVNIVGESKSVNGLRPVNLIGPRQAAIVAKDLIMEIVDSDSRNTNPGGSGPPRNARNAHDGGAGGHGGHDKINDSIYVPSEAVGMIIGKGGETIREMQSSTGCKINVSQPSGPNETEREIGLVGTREAISLAKQAIEDKVDAVRQKGSHPGGGRGRPPRDYDNPSYGQPSHQAPSQAPAAQPPAGGSGDGADPYAACMYSPSPYY